ncbi:class I SAM-dependent methyltransferase [Enterovibrio norvegicus]|uniref:Methyltransferase n=1 Tax=Enterovibrio norvegicus TaxID=188144 RepID=A0A2N7L5I9_9GAMM|nr:class I SAM-dependent methyltransferase [Enterovibrio norvegicus]PML80848.1 methyltransferase [Enterovibrio norvegicus]PMN67378.1 methyltransferase [Enterovibrio norvegicus]PMN88925.1 methyltransferase [Enterovibrio norvegicus]
MSASVERQREHFNSIAKQYLKGKEDPRFLKLQSLIWERVISSLPEELRDMKVSVLEPMCGYTEGLKVLNRANLDIEYSGFDYSEEIVNHLKSISPELNVFHGDITKFKADAQYDVIILIGGLHHVPNFAKEAVRNLADCLRSGGFFINFEPTHGNPLNKFVREYIYKKNEIFDHDTERDFSVKELEFFFEEAGLKNQFKFYPGLLAYILYYNPYAFPRLNKGSEKTVERIFSIESAFYENFIGRALSFCTLTVWKK